MYHEISGSTGDLTWMHECARAVVIFIYGLALVRIAGRRLFGKWSALDIIVSIMIGSNLSRALTGSAQLGATLAATTLLIFLHWLLRRPQRRAALCRDCLQLRRRPRRPRAIEGGSRAPGLLWRPCLFPDTLGHCYANPAASHSRK